MSKSTLHAQDPLHAANPNNSAIVKASAGVGKTYLLVTRLVRLLMDDVRPDSILAITFTRKAAAEMQSRLSDRLYALAIGSDAEMAKALQTIDIIASEQNVNKARGLYENLLRSEHQIKTSTFHAFCQEILRKFPLEANVPPGFELLDDEATYRINAWEALYDRATKNPDDATSQALENLYDLTGSLHSTHQALDSFLDQRSDWWAYTNRQPNPVQYAIEQLQQQLEVDANQSPYLSFFHSQHEADFTRLAKLIATHDTKTNVAQAEAISEMLASKVFTENNQDEFLLKKALAVLQKTFIDSKGNLKELKANKTRLKKLGEAAEAELVTLFSSLSIRFAAFNELLAKHHNLQLSSAWYAAGQELVSAYQQIKLQQRLLDFTDLEWKTYELLNHSDNNLWVQYKLDQRIDHFLIDEFQDTNPTQWRLIYPLLQEFAQSTDKKRSVFIVGDAKQSIYSFRRADPQLLSTAADWLVDNLDAKVYPMDRSRRSSPPIMHLVNAAFEDSSVLPDFHLHSTFLEKIPGKVCLLPLIEKEKNQEQAIYFRNPLKQPLLDADNPYFKEGELIASTINDVLSSIAIHSEGKNRKANYGDIMILVRSRKHVDDYETALREANIPYQSNNKGTLFECQEVQDLISLLDVLYTPYDNIALATTLRSPIFQCNNQDLIFLAKQTSTDDWYEKLQQAATQQACSIALKNAAAMLANWRKFIGILPMHDLLNTIYHQGNIVARYLATIPPHFHKRVQANLKHFLSLALEMDSGRYPSLGRFIAKLRHLMQNDQSLGEAPSGNLSGAVKILTIHASKGLEAPVVFLADCADKKSSSSKTYSALAQWPQHEEQPTDFMLCPTKSNRCDYVDKLLKLDEKKSDVENANLLYVALTRARQVLYVSGSTNNVDGDNGWYTLLQRQWSAIQTTDTFSELDSYSIDESIEHSPNSEPETIPPLFSSKVLIAQETENEDINKQQRGIFIHRALELISNNTNSSDLILTELCNEFGLTNDNAEFVQYFQEALNVIQHREFAQFFDGRYYSQAYNEIRVQTHVAQSIEQGIIDRLIINQDLITIVDYKTHSQLQASELATVARSYKNQLNRYRLAAEKLWPGYEIKTIVLFTHYLKYFDITH